MKTMIFALAMSFTLLAWGDAPKGWMELKVRDKVYHDVKVVGVEGSSLKVLHATGAARISMDDLAADIQAAFNYDPIAAKERAEKLDKQRRKEEEARVLLEKKKVAMAATISQVLKDGVVLKDIYYLTDRNADFQDDTHIESSNLRSFGDTIVFVKCDTAGLYDGDKFRKLVYPYGTFEGRSNNKGHVKIRAFTTSAETFLSAPQADAVIHYTPAAKD